MALIAEPKKIACVKSESSHPRMIDLYNTLLEKNAPDMIRAATVRAAMQNAQTLNVVRLKASQMLSASESKVTMVSRFRFAGASPYFTL
jgi:hypothetical protein